MNPGDDSDYLWDRGDPADPEIVRLEALLAPARMRTQRRRASPRRRGPRRLAWAAAAMLLLGLGLASLLAHRLAWREDAPWPLLATRGEVLSRPAGSTGPHAASSGPPAAALAPGAELRTGADGEAWLGIARIGRLHVAPGSRLRLDATRAGHHRLRLFEGRVHARVWAPPGHFGIAVAGGELVDLGCEFTVEVDAAGDGLLEVHSGWVMLEAGGHEALVPAGARLALRGGEPAGLPYDAGASPRFLAALGRVQAGDGVDPQGAEIRELLASAGPRDAISLLSLLQRQPALAAGPLFDDLRARLGASSVVRADVLARRAGALDAWWDALPYPRAKQWWWQWRDALPASAG